MTQRSLVELAQQGDVAAIAALLNSKLQNSELEPRGITARANLQADCLQVMLVANEVPDQAATSTLIQTALTDLDLDFIATVKLYGRQIEDEFPAWSQALDLHPAATPPSEATPPEATPFSRRHSAFMQSLRTFKFSTVVPYKDV